MILENKILNDSLTSRAKIRLDTLSDINEFVAIASTCPSEVILLVVDGYGMCVSARSVLGLRYAQEFKHMWLVSNNSKIHTLFEKFIRE